MIGHLMNCLLIESAIIVLKLNQLFMLMRRHIHNTEVSHLVNCFELIAFSIQYLLCYNVLICKVKVWNTKNIFEI